MYGTLSKKIQNISHIPGNSPISLPSQYLLSKVNHSSDFNHEKGVLFQNRLYLIFSWEEVVTKNEEDRLRYRFLATQL